MEINYDTTKVQVGQFITPFHSFRTILNAEDCAIWLKRQKDMIGWTFCFTPISLHLYKFKRLIAAKCNGDMKYSGINTDIRFASNIHSKCYISVHQVLIGSYNLTAPTIEDIGVLISDKPIIAHLKKEFNVQWKLLS